MFVHEGARGPLCGCVLPHPSVWVLTRHLAVVWVVSHVAVWAPSEAAVVLPYPNLEGQLPDIPSWVSPC